MGKKIAVNGFGTIGKRVSEAVRLQNDMYLLGVTKTKPNFEAFIANQKNIDLYVPKDKIEDFEAKGIKVKGSIDELFGKADLVIDATPSGIGATYKEIYSGYSLKMVFQGGEKPEVADLSYSTLCNHEKAIGKKSVRVVSCNTTGLLRLICSLKEKYSIQRIKALMVRRGSDPKEVKRGPINSIVLDPKIPSHHGVDVKTVVPDINIITAAIVVPTTLMHVHYINITFEKKITRKDIIEVLENSPRIILIDAPRMGIKSTSELIEYFRDYGRKRNDIPELVVWENMIHVEDKEATIVQSVHQESIVIPENIDATRALLSLEKDKKKTIEKTNNTLGILGGRLS